jgi:hypothetical protein
MDIQIEDLPEATSVHDSFAHIAYIKPLAKGETGYSVHSSDGKQLAVFQNYDAAFFTARQYNLAPVNVH